MDESKQQARATWSAGDYDAIVDYIWSVGGELVERVGVEAGDEVLDVACGTGNAAIPAAVAGGWVTGLDLTPELFEDARRRANEAGVEVEWVEGDAEALPYDDASFDVVLSTFGCMFAPSHETAAAEIARVLKPQGRLGVAAWTPDGSIGRFFASMGPSRPNLRRASSPHCFGAHATTYQSSSTARRPSCVSRMPPSTSASSRSKPRSRSTGRASGQS